MNLSEMLAELKRQRRGLNRAIAALEALQKLPRGERKLVAHTAQAGRGKFKNGNLVQQKNGTTGLLIPFSPDRSQK